MAVVGGGISGLSAALRLTERCPDHEVTLLEKAPRVGGVIQSTRRDGYTLEHSADSFLVTEQLASAKQLCDQLGVETIPTDSQRRGAAILRDGTLHPVPEGLHLMSVRQLLPMMRSPLISWSGKLRVLAERFVAAKRDGKEESLGQFARRRYGQEVFERIIQPLVSGIYTADPEKLSMNAALPQFVKQEQQYGSLLRAAMHVKRDANESADRGARYSLFRSPRDGMQSLLDALEHRLLESNVTIRRNTSVETLSREGEQWQLSTGEGGIETYDGLVLALPMQAVPEVTKTLDPTLAQLATQIEHVGTAIICLGYRQDQVGVPLTCFGSVIPFVEARRILAISHTNVKFPARAPDGCVLLRVFVGGALQPEIAECDDKELLAIATEELGSILKVSGEPHLHQIIRWPNTTPQYTLGHKDRIQQILERIEALPAISMANNALAGVGVPQCIRGGWKAADDVVAQLALD